MLVWLISALPICSAIFFGLGGGGGSGCCCGCGTPQPSSCGCQTAVQCPPPQPCPVCQVTSCPPAPVAYCPQVQPVYVPSCGTGDCGGGYATGCGGSGCNGGRYSTGGGGYTQSNGGYATGGIFSSNGDGGGYTNNNVKSNVGYQQPVSASFTHEGAHTDGSYTAHADDKIGPLPPPPGSNYVPPSSQEFRSPQACDPARIKYVVLRAKKVEGAGTEEVEEEMEEIERPTPVEATASPLEAKEIGDDISRNEATDEGNVEDFIKARGTTTFTDAKCTSKQLRDLIMENIVKDDALSSKRTIHDSSLKRFPDSTVDVICSSTGFTYLVSTTEHCEAQKDNVICFVYKRPI